MNYFPYLFFLVSLSVVSFMVFALLYILDFAKVKPQQKIMFLKFGLVMIMLAPFMFSVARLYSPPMLEMTLPGQFFNQEMIPHTSIMLHQSQIAWPFYIIFIYGAGLCIMLSRILFSYLSAKKQLRSATPVVMQGQTVFINKHIQSPLSFGLLKAKIYFPLDAELRWTSREIQMILAHETIHVEKHDSLWKLFSLIVQALLFFAPWSYFLHRRLELEMEIFCDFKTCKQTNADIKEYGNLLLATACAQPQNLMFSNMTDPTLKRRLLAMKSKTVNAGILVAILSLVLLLIGTTAIGMTSGMKEKRFFRITTKIIVDGKLVSNPQILAKENQQAMIVITNTNQGSAQGLKMKLLAKNVGKFAKNNAIEVDYEIEYKNGGEVLHTNPQMIVIPNQEAKISLSSDLHHSYEMFVLAERE